MSATLGVTSQVDLTAPFSPFSQSWSTGSYSPLVPIGPTQAVITVRGAGGSGACPTTNSSGQGGGGGGGYSKKTVAINASDWGVSFSVAVGGGGAVSSGAGIDGANSTFGATWHVGILSVAANGGAGGSNTSGGSGGTGTGGDTNTSGGNGTTGISGKGGDGGGPGGGVGGLNNSNGSSVQSGNIPGGGGGAVVSPKTKIKTSGRGADGLITVDWS